ncbi:MAG: methyltransferase domain-containing protein [Candidatus Accumulibacter sp. UW26]
MRVHEAQVYACPACKMPLQLSITIQTNNEVVAGSLSCQCGQVFQVAEGVPDLTYPQQLAASDLEAKHWYDANADVYDENLHLTFDTFGENEDLVRSRLVDRLALKRGHCVLELGAGSGRDSLLIADRLGPEGRLYLQDLSLAILSRSFPKITQMDVPTEFHVGNACNLPFADHVFDAVFHFGGLNTFSDIPGFFREINRVAKVGAKIVVGDESMPVWLRDTEFGRVLMNSNPLYRYDLPLQYLPVSCREVKLEWIIGGVFYAIEYRVGEGEPFADLDFEIPGARGGSHRTRYYGMLEGVTAKAKSLAQLASAKSGKSMHRWLDDVVRIAATRDLESE